jgi:hypothetical protein
VVVGVIDSSIESILVCPANQARPERRDQTYLCSECAAGYPTNEAIPLQEALINAKLLEFERARISRIAGR